MILNKGGLKMFEPDPAIVELQQNGEFFIQWKTKSPSQAVTIYSGLSTADFDWDRPLLTTQEEQALLSGLEADFRRYFYLQADSADAQIAAERRLPIEGAKNFRDLGGYQNKDGRRVKWGLLYRSGRLSELTDEDVRYFSRLNIGTICDFRRDDEQMRSPSRLPDDPFPTIRNLTIGAGSSKTFLERVENGKAGTADMAAAMIQIYEDFVENQADPYSEMFECLLQTNQQGVLIHCTAGKDRTGFGAALILYALGVDKETIMEDYLLTTRYFPIDYEMKLMAEKYAVPDHVDLNAMRPVFEVRREYLETAFDLIEKEYNSIDTYLDRCLNVNRDVREELMDKFLEE
jgi:protein-tyrosine phosphatase